MKYRLITFFFLSFRSASETKMLSSGDEFTRQHSNTSSTGGLIEPMAVSGGASTTAPATTTLHHHHHHHHHHHTQQQTNSLIPKQVSSQQPFNPQGTSSSKPLRFSILSLTPRLPLTFLLQHSCVRYPRVPLPPFIALHRQSTVPLQL